VQSLLSDADEENDPAFLDQLLSHSHAPAPMQAT
jgi:hypothetical protein